ncbi:amino acid ABC transporter permease [Fervidibacillus halotolerans]|uniref:Amino acid ABC transporter permease n=1 Tax=Fervidibacillus halotolerans TaxID=2980027 RepID=A0A9E8LYI5_9BACI|nr:amino acid ABC transporter permease [Fervidibacillus halotolerans]WAA11929.1 amino acid ABC transporter permease [Fervidibacillus halotolerans]
MSLEYILKISGPMLEGAKVTLLTFFIVIIISIPLGLFITLAGRSRFRPIVWFIKGYIYVMRGTPLLLQLLVLCFGLPMIPVIGQYLVLDRFLAAVIGFVLNYAAYFAEIFRGGLLAIDKGQYEAAQVLGMNRWQRMTRIILPQMFRVTLPSVTNETITLVKDTALLYAVAVPELLHYAQTAVNRDFTIVPFFIAGLMYLMITLVLTFFLKRIEMKVKFE